MTSCTSVSKVVLQCKAQTLQGTTITLTVHQPIIANAQFLGAHVTKVAYYNWEVQVHHQHMILLPMSLVRLVWVSTALMVSSLCCHTLMSKSSQAFSATDQHLSDDLGLCLHLVIAPLDVVHEMGGDTSHGVFAHDPAIGPSSSGRSGCLG